MYVTDNNQSQTTPYLMLSSLSHFMCTWRGAIVGDRRGTVPYNRKALPHMLNHATERSNNLQSTLPQGWSIFGNVINQEKKHEVSIILATATINHGPVPTLRPRKNRYAHKRPPLPAESHAYSQSPSPSSTGLPLYMSSMICSMLHGL